jgi:Fur family ferric uptake transcriptional regulator
MENLLKNRKIRVTPFRIEVLEAFNSFENAIDLSQLEQVLGDFDRITLYIPLKTFQEKGLIHEIVMTGEMPPIIQ